MPRAGPLARAAQLAGSALVLVAPFLLLAGFCVEPNLRGLDRPCSRPALYGLLAGMLLHAASGWRRPPAR